MKRFRLPTDHARWNWALWQLVIWGILMLAPGIIGFLSTLSLHRAVEIARANMGSVLPVAIFYMANFCVLIPCLLYRKGWKWAFWAVNLLFIAFCDLHAYVNIQRSGIEQIQTPSMVWISLCAVCVFMLVIMGLAMSVSYVQRTAEMRVRMQEEKKRHAEAELDWLKNQLNPHFLFNTLNNISSLVHVDADIAQESIGQLSDLLRYTLYESNHPLVPVAGEVEFMQNYIDLMKLRCNDLTRVETDLRVPPRPMQVVPLLFISLIENAFKHGVNSRMDSFVHIGLRAEGDDLVFTCKNSLHPRPTVDRAGSGIGLENLRRRLELTYPGRYVYRQETRAHSYFVEVTLRQCAFQAESPAPTDRPQ